MRKVLLVSACIVLCGVTHGLVFCSFLSMWSLLTQVDEARLLDGLNSGAQTTVVYDRNKTPLFTFYSEQRMDVAFDQVSPHFINALLAAEDRRYFWHHGVDPVRIVGAGLANLRARRITEGGSTITQQLVRSTLLNSERTYDRKIREILIAAAAESRFSKKAILEAYFNRIYFGDGYHGVEAAARGYFGKPASRLDAAEAALLAGLIKAPSMLTPRRSPELARRRRNVVLRAMLKQGWLAPEQFREAAVAPVTTVARVNPNGHARHAPGDDNLCGLYFKEAVRKELVALFGEHRVYGEGLRVYSTMDVPMQVAAERTIRHRILDLARAKRSRNVNGVGLQGSLVAVEAKTGNVLALVGGLDFHSNRYDRATQSRRPPGSAFKPLVFAAALERGYSPGSVLDELDVPITRGSESWLPDGEHEASQYTLRRALKVSSNRAAAQLMQRVGISSTLEMSRRLGIHSQLPAVPSLAIGTGAVTLLELTSAYGAFANRGLVASPRFIRRVEDRYGRVLWEEPSSPHRVLSESTAFLMSTMLADVVNGGTAATARQAGFRLPAAGKTGTSDNYADAWFVGYTPTLVAGVWFGYDRPTTIMDRGFASVVAVPAWADFMKQATAKDKADSFAMPSDVERVAICRVSGQRAVEGCRAASTVEQVVWETTPDGLQYPRVIPAGGVVEEYFSRGAAPWSLCSIHSAEYADFTVPEDRLSPMEVESRERPVGTSGILPIGTPVGPPASAVGVRPGIPDSQLPGVEWRPPIPRPLPEPLPPDPSPPEY